MELAVPKISALLILLFLSLNFCGEFGSEAQVIPDDEVQALKTIAVKINITYWKNVNKNSCTRSGDLNVAFPKDILSNVTCNCSYNSSSICHITNIELKGLDLTGILPQEFGNLPFLQEIDLSRNYLNGTIPKSWSTLPLTIVSLLANSISGSIPKEIGDIVTLRELNLQDNQLDGPLPPALSNLKSLRRLLLSGNNFTGTLPQKFGDLKNLRDFRIDGTSISGNLPEFIGNWTELSRLEVQGTSMEGPIPSAVSLLKNLTILRISDLKGPSTQKFPDLKDLTVMRDLVLRNCLISGSIPQYIGQVMTNLDNMDLSFNRLDGTIPDNLQLLEKLRFVYLTNNSLTGPIPSWIVNTKRNFDISYNNFTGSAQSSCQESNVNKISSFSSPQDKSTPWCLKKDLPCSSKPKYFSLFINCGGPAVNFEGNDYEADLSTMGPSTFFWSNGKWASSTMGIYIGNATAIYSAQSSPNMTAADLYTTARLAPVSLKYYGLCLRPGNYNVTLHFAEIMFPANQPNNGPGKRIFDVSIQGKSFLKDFNIAEEAKGVGKRVTKELNIDVTNGTLEIHLYWRGKGTSSIPFRSVYGPLISAITVEPNFDPGTDTGRMSVGLILGIVAAACVLVLLILAALRKKGYLGGRDLENKGLCTTGAGKSTRPCRSGSGVKILEKRGSENVEHSFAMHQPIPKSSASYVFRCKHARRLYSSPSTNSGAKLKS
ncbi:hypothetical protein MKW98_008229 [Papaver atlanticum]|uniref:non-specific serine/threonine protein kinase n=1 Tax=Papaver atlanticum TaxID=357466 RepID=A0AAD4X3P1_9MAGN|nr:hypothetical protein MKW98_008229 [Papaver atlanticum]